MYQIYNEDCLQGMSRIETGTVDATTIRQGDCRDTAVAFLGGEKFE